MEIAKGTEIACYYDGKLRSIVKADRVTPTQIVLPNGTKLRHNLSEVGGGSFSQSSYEFVTPAIKENMRLLQSRAVVAKKLEALALAVKSGDMDFLIGVNTAIIPFLK